MSTIYGMDRLIRNFEELLASDSARDRSRRNKKGQFHYIPLSNEQFLEQVDVAVGMLDNGKKFKFVDVGCGIGSKVLLAAGCHHNCIASGIEIEQKYVRVAANLFAVSEWKSRLSVKYGDALKQSYGQYDIIYFYCPLLDNDLQIQLEKRIASTARVGTLFLVNMRQSTLWDESPKMERVWRNKIYRKIKR